MNNNYKIIRFERDLDIFPDYIIVKVMAIENSTNLIRLFISKPFMLKEKWDKEQVQTRVEIFVDKFVGSIDIRQDYDLIDFDENLKFTKCQNGRFYNHKLIDNYGKLKKGVWF